MNMPYPLPRFLLALICLSLACSLLARETPPPPAAPTPAAPPPATAAPSASPASGGADAPPPTASATAAAPPAPTLPPAGPLLAPGNWDSLVVLAQSGLQVGGASGTLDDVAWAPAGRVFAVSFRIVHLFDGDTLERVFPLSPADEQDLRGPLAFSPDGRWLAAGRYGSGVALLDANAHEVLRAFTGPSEGWVLSLALSPDGRRLAAGAEDGQAAVWDADSGAIEWSSVLEGGGVAAIAWRSDGRMLAAAGQDGPVLLLDPAGGEVLASLDLEGPVRDVEFIPGGAELLTAGRHIQLWDSDSRQLIETFRLRQAASPLAVSPNGGLFAMGRCAEGSEDNPFQCAADGEILFWDVASREFLGTINAHAGRTILAAFSPDGTRLATVSDFGGDALRLWAAAQ